MENIHYTDRYVVYMDLLGWSAEMSGISEGMRHALQAIHETVQFFLEEQGRTQSDFLDQTGSTTKSNHVAASAFSDSFFLSAPESLGALLMLSASYLIRRLLKIGFLVRGGFTFGPAYHKGNIMLGPAISEAVKLEESATYPRILMGNSALQSNSIVHRGEWRNFICEDMLNRKVLNIAYTDEDSFSHMKPTAEEMNRRGLRWSEGEYDRVAYELAYTDYLGLSEMEASIRIGMSAVSKNPNQLEKWNYMKNVLELMTTRTLGNLRREAHGPRVILDTPTPGDLSEGS